MLGTVAHGVQFHLRASAGHSNHHLQAGREEITACVHHFDESSHHLLTGTHIGYHAVAQWSDGLDVGVRLLVHHLGLLANGYHALGPTVQCHHAGLIYHYLAIAYDDGVGGAQVHGHFFAE